MKISKQKLLLENRLKYIMHLGQVCLSLLIRMSVL